jgi:2,3-bisphosphoglycerate-dependent phosphoglycerate mutase
MPSTLVLIRHGQSEWNQKNIFTGWIDVSLSDAGIKEALSAREALKDYRFDAVFTSALSRAQDTAAIVLKDRAPPPCFSSEALNERNYGELQGKNKDEMRRLYGEDMVQVWRRSFDVRPPGGESLKDTCERVLPYFEREILPLLRRGETVLISAHGNSLRALVKVLENLSDDEIVGVEIPTGIPIVYRLDDDLSIISKKMLSA